MSDEDDNRCNHYVNRSAEDREGLCTITMRGCVAVKRNYIYDDRLADKCTTHNLGDPNLVDALRMIHFQRWKDELGERYAEGLGDVMKRFREVGLEIPGEDAGGQDGKDS
tara:strand:- start:2281 stop:2610 length:330 start_codon:yes stop_codon:yes gene_type:complete